MFYVLFTLLCVYSSIAIILMGKRELIALLNLSSLCFVMVERLFLAVPRGCLQFVIVVFPDHTHLLFLIIANHKVRFPNRLYHLSKLFLHHRYGPFKTNMHPKVLRMLYFFLISI